MLFLNIWGASSILIYMAFQGPILTYPIIVEPWRDLTMKLVVPTLPLFNQSKVHLQPDGEKLVLTKKRSALRHLQSMTMMMLRHVKMAKVQESPSSWHSSSSFAKVREIPQIGTPLFSKLYRTDERTDGRTDICSD